MPRTLRVVLGAPEARRVIFSANLRDFAVPAVFAAVHQEPSRANPIGKLRKGGSDFSAPCAVEVRSTERAYDQWAIAPARCDVVKARLDLLGCGVRPRAFTQIRVQRRLQSFRAERCTIQIEFLGSGVRSRFEFVIDDAQSVAMRIEVDPIHAAAEPQISE